MMNLTQTAEHYEKLAVQAENQAAWDRANGFDLSRAGDSPGDHKADTYRRTAQALREEAKTGLPHCVCHVLTLDKCPSQPKEKH